MLLRLCSRGDCRMSTSIKRIAFAMTFALAAAGARADDYPNKPIHIMVSFAAGGPTDTVARVMGAKMSEVIGQQFIVENRTGAGGNLGADLVAKSPPDGYMILMATVSTHAINP